MRGRMYAAAPWKLFPVGPSSSQLVTANSFSPFARSDAQSGPLTGVHFALARAMIPIPTRTLQRTALRTALALSAAFNELHSQDRPAGASARDTTLAANHRFQ